MRRREIREEMICLSTVIALLAWAIWDALTFPARARVFPVVVAGAALLLGLVEVARLTFRELRRARPAVSPDASTDCGEMSSAGRANVRATSTPNSYLLIGCGPTTWYKPLNFLWSISSNRRAVSLTSIGQKVTSMKPPMFLPSLRLATKNSPRLLRPASDQP